jgi:hypothetical protein
MRHALFRAPVKGTVCICHDIFNLSNTLCIQNAVQERLHRKQSVTISRVEHNDFLNCNCLLLNVLPIMYLQYCISTKARKRAAQARQNLFIYFFAANLFGPQTLWRHNSYCRFNVDLLYRTIL